MINNGVHVIPFTTGEYQTNNYIIYRDSSKEAVIVDAGHEIHFLIEEIEEMGLKVEHLLLTHGHTDHIAGVEELVNKYNCKVYALKAEEELLGDPNKNLSLYTEKYLKITEFEKLLEDGEFIELSGFTFEVIHTPGHTSGSGCFKMDDRLFAGDTIFAESYGRFDLPTGSRTALVNSIREKIFVLPEDTIIYPGHGPGTILKTELEENPINSLF